MPREEFPPGCGPPRQRRLRSHEEEVAGVQGAELHVLEHQPIVVIKGDDHVVAALAAVGRQFAEAREECRDVDDVAARSAGRKIRDGRSAGPVLDDNEVIAAAEKEIAGEGAAFAEDERVRAVAQNDISHDAPVIDHGLLAGAAEDRNGGALDEAEILQPRGHVRGGQAVPLQDVQLDGGRTRRPGSR